jgi:tRNA1(Val) A37 N6-methylase TrmN6
VEAACRGREGLAVDAPLIVENDRGGYTEEMERIFRWEF